MLEVLEREIKQTKLEVPPPKKGIIYFKRIQVVNYSVTIWPDFLLEMMNVLQMDKTSTKKILKDAVYSSTSVKVKEYSRDIAETKLCEILGIFKRHNQVLVTANIYYE